MSDRLDRSSLIFVLGFVLAGGDMSQTVSSAYGSAEEQAFVKAMLEVQLSATECDELNERHSNPLTQASWSVLG